MSKWDMRGSASSLPPPQHSPSCISERVRLGSNAPGANPQCLDRVVSGASEKAAAQGCV